jgi:hypothetical protein
MENQSFKMDLSSVLIDRLFSRNISIIDGQNKVSDPVPVGGGPDGVAVDPSLNRINFIIWSQDLKILNSMVSQAAGTYGAGRVGVYLVSFGEVVPIFIEAQNQPVLPMEANPLPFSFSHVVWIILV